MTAAAGTEPLLRAEGASFGYGGKAVIAGVDLEVRPGELLGIVGPDGSGKTTLFRGLLGLIQPLAGRLKRGRAAVGYVPQREELDAVYPLTVQEIVHMGGYGRLEGWRRFWRAPGRGERAQVSRCLEAVGLAFAAKKPFAALSGGQRQRVLIARALMTEPALLVLDEPTAGVDRAAARGVLELIGTMNRERGIAVLIVAHQLDQVRDFTTEVLLVMDGSVRRGFSQELLAPERLDDLYGAARPLAED